MNCVFCGKSKCDCSIILCTDFTRKPPTPEHLAKQFHETYERLAPQFGHETRKELAKPWADVPENNKQLMIAVCGEIMLQSMECDSEEGVTIGLIDAIIACFNSLQGRNMEHPQIQEALRDLAANKILRRWIIAGQLGFDPDKLIRIYRTDQLERAMAAQPEPGK